jgi:hypothetical protein
MTGLVIFQAGARETRHRALRRAVKTLSRRSRATDRDSTARPEVCSLRRSAGARESRTSLRAARPNGTQGTPVAPRDEGRGRRMPRRHRTAAAGEPAFTGAGGGGEAFFRVPHNRQHQLRNQPNMTSLHSVQAADPSTGRTYPPGCKCAPTVRRTLSPFAVATPRRTTALLLHDNVAAIVLWINASGEYWGM